MQAPSKKMPVPRKGGRILLLLLMLIALALGSAGLYLALQPEPLPQAESAATAQPIVSREEASLSTIAVTLLQGENYTLRYDNGRLIYQGDEPFNVDETLAAEILTACTQLSSLETLSEDPAEYGEHLADFGLDPAQCSVTIVYTDGSSLTYHIGDQLPLDSGYYFQVEGDARLYRVHDDLLDTFQVEAGILYPVEQLRLSQTLMDRIALYDGQGVLLSAFEKQADGPFCMTAPVRYPVIGDIMDSITKALANFSLGAYVGPDTPDIRTAQGLGDAQYRLVIHEAAGSAMETTADGAVQSVARAARETTLTLWPLKEGEASGYCAVHGGIYKFLRLSLAFLYDLDLTVDLLPTQPAAIPLESLDSLTVQNAQGTTVYALSRTPRRLETGDVETDQDGNPVYDTAVTANGQPLSLDAFAARLEALNRVTVSGRLPAEFTPAGDITDTLTFVTTAGTIRTVTLAPYDALHNAVGIDGVYLFYLIKGGMTF